MIKKKILIISNYPIKDPLHGGQKRVAAIVEEYKKVFSEVKFVAIFMREHYPQYSNDDIYLVGNLAERVKGNYLTSDIEIANAMISDQVVRKKVERLLLSFQPDILQIEQTFPFIGLKKILEDLDLHPKIVYSAHNIEAPMRKEIMEIGEASDQDIEKAVSLIQNTEEYLAKKADIVIAVSKEVKDTLLSYGAKKVVLAPNGVYPITPSRQDIIYWRALFAKSFVEKIALFIGSGHLPNVSGFKKMVGYRVGFVPPNAKLVLAGGVGHNIEENFDQENILDSPFWKRVINLGILEQDKLEGLINFADVILLPIVDGGGSNLKTAEAILSGRKIVATRFAFRGYEEFLKLPNIWVADEQQEYVRSIKNALELPIKERTSGEISLAEKVLWDHCLQEMISEVANL